MINFILWGVFAVIVVGFLVYDLLIVERNVHAVTFKSAVKQTVFWVVVSLFYAALVWFLSGANAGSEFLTAYLSEKAASLDNLFVFSIIFTYFGVDARHRHKLLYWGFLGAIAFRFVLLFTGIGAINAFPILELALAVFLVWSGIKLFGAGEDDEFSVSDSKAYKWLTAHLKISGDAETGNIFTRENGRLLATPLLLTLLVIELSDVAFAFDSAALVMGITSSTLIAYTATILACAGLRAMYFVLENLMSQLVYLNRGLATILVMIGAKILAVKLLGIEIPSVASLVGIFLILGVTVVASLCRSKKSS